MTPANLFDHLGRLVRLGQKLGTGGEGSVFQVTTAPDLVAKVYHKPPSFQVDAKLRAMRAHRTQMNPHNRSTAYRPPPHGRGSAQSGSCAPTRRAHPATAASMTCSPA